MHLQSRCWFAAFSDCGDNIRAFLWWRYFQQVWRSYGDPLIMQLWRILCTGFMTSFLSLSFDVHLCELYVDNFSSFFHFELQDLKANTDGQLCWPFGWVCSLYMLFRWIMHWAVSETSESCCGQVITVCYCPWYIINSACTNTTFLLIQLLLCNCEVPPPSASLLPLSPFSTKRPKPGTMCPDSPFVIWIIACKFLQCHCYTAIPFITSVAVRFCTLLI